MSKFKYIVWIGGVDEYFKDYESAKKCYDYWKSKKYDQVIIQKINE